MFCTNLRALPRALSWSLLAFAAAAQAASPAASACPDYFGIGPNIAGNPSFEVGDPASTGCGDNMSPSAAEGWDVRADQAKTSVCTKRVASTVENGGRVMLEVTSDKQLGGIWQRSKAEPGKAYMFSVWIKALKGQVSIQSRGMSGGPTATTLMGTHGEPVEWEQLRVCTNSLAETDYLFIVSQTPTAHFLVDKVELREIPVRE